MNILFIALLICCFKSGVFFSSLKSVNNRLTRFSRSGKHGRLGHVIGIREMSRGRSLRSIHFICFLTIWVTVENSSKCVFVIFSMLGRVKNSHYSSCLYSDREFCFSYYYSGRKAPSLKMKTVFLGRRRRCPTF